jgi:hypothetical protein
MTMATHQEQFWELLGVAKLLHYFVGDNGAGRFTLERRHRVIFGPASMDDCVGWLASRQGAENGDGAEDATGAVRKVWDDHIYSTHNEKNGDEPERGEYFDALKGTGIWAQGDELPGIHYDVDDVKPITQRRLTALPNDTRKRRAQTAAHQSGTDKATRGKTL